MKRRTKQITAALTAGIAAVSIVPIQAAIADSSPPSEYITFSIQENGQLIARGVSVVVAVEYTCSEGAAYGLWVNARQRVSGNNIARADGEVGVPLACDGEPRVAEVTLESYEFAFNRGEALISATTNACLPDGCRQYEDQVITTLKNRRPSNW